MQQSIPRAVRLCSSPQRWGALVLLALGSLVPRPAFGDVTACIGAHESGQVESKAGHLKRAAELFAACGATEDCPAPIRAECVELYREVEKSVPTVIFAAIDEQGKDVTNVQVYAADQLLTGSLDGRSLAIDPGKYTLRFAFPNGKTVSVDVLVREGEKNRVVSVKSHASADAGMSATPAAPGQETSGVVRDGESPLPVAFWISAGVSAAAIASWGTFALLGRGQQSKLDECSPKCDAAVQNNFDAMRRDYLIADLSLGVAALSAGFATWFLLSKDSSPSAATLIAKPSARVSLAPLLSPSSAGLVVAGEAF